MDTLDKILLENLGIDFRYGEYYGMKHMLFEVHGYVPNIDTYIDCISDAIYPHIHDMVENGYANFTFDESAFDRMEDKFFDTALFDVTLALGKNIYNECSYDEVSSGIADGKRFIRVAMNVSDENLMDLMASVNKGVSHELLHAYQDMSTLEKSGRRITDTFDKKRYNRIVRMYRGQGDGHIHELLWMLYNTEPIEANALTAEIRAELQSNRDFIDGSRRAEEAIRNTETYGRLKDCWDTIEKLRGVTDTHVQDSITDVYNSLFGTNMKSYGKVVKRLTARVERFSNHVMERASKTAYDVFADRKPCIIR